MGFNQAIDMSSEILSDVKLVQEKRLMEKFFKEIREDNGKYVSGLDDTMIALEIGAIETLIVWENLDFNRLELKNKLTEEIVVKYSNNKQASGSGNINDEETKNEMEIQEKALLLEWLVENYKRFGCTLEIVTDRSAAGSQFCKGFGGIGGILRYQLDASCFNGDSNDEESYEDSE